MRNRYGGRIFVGGMVIASPFAPRVVDLAARNIAAACKAHLLEALSRVEPHPSLRSAE
jgi:hypothetical protein